MTKVLVTGGTGLIGRHLYRRLRDKGYEVSILSRTVKNDSEIPIYIWDLAKNEIDEEAINNTDYIVHLAGVNLWGKRWTSKRRQEILDSRFRTGELIFNKIKNQTIRPRCFITASAIGYYGSITSEKIFSETEPSSNDFLGQICRKWEEVADRFTDIGVRSVKIRTGIVLTNKGGALSKITRTVKMGIGSAIGNGKQYFPWIHIEDLCSIYIKAIEDIQMEGAYNAVVPEHITNKEFIRQVAQILKKPFWFPNIPAIVLKSIFGKMSVMVLYGSRISSDKIKDTGYEFIFPNLISALKQLNL